MTAKLKVFGCIGSVPPAVAAVLELPPRRNEAYIYIAAPTKREALELADQLDVGVHPADLSLAWGDDALLLLQDGQFMEPGVLAGRVTGGGKVVRVCQICTATVVGEFGRDVLNMTFTPTQSPQAAA